MKISLPTNIKNPNEQKFVESNCIVVIGANGSGKTRFGTAIEFTYSPVCHRIAAQKSLKMPDSVSPTSLKQASADLFFGHATNTDNKMGFRWGNSPYNPFLDDFNKLMILLQTQEVEIAIKFKDEYIPNQTIERPQTNLDKVKRIWELVLPHRKLNKVAGKIETYTIDRPNEVYKSSEMSDGERVIFYLIGEVVCVPEKCIIIIDEPEMHIHKAITKKLWNEIELERPDCTFIYLTHDIEFAISRQNSTKIWMKGFHDHSQNNINNNFLSYLWDYDILLEEAPIPEQLYLDILGSREPILFIEGDTSSLDYKLLPLIFSDYNVKSVGSCSKVIETTKAFNEQKQFHSINSYGIIDRDRRTDDEIRHLKSDSIWLAEVAEIENFLILEEVIRVMALKMSKDAEEVIKAVKVNVIEFFKTELQRQVVEHTVARLDRIFKEATNIKGLKNWEDIDNKLSDYWVKQDLRILYEEIEKSFKSLIATNDYFGILKVFNNKGLLINSKVAELCDINPKAYPSQVIEVLRLGDVNSKIIKDSIKAKIIIL